MTTLLDEALRALRGVVRVADRATDEFDAAREVLARAAAQKDESKSKSQMKRIAAQKDEAQGMTDAYDGFYRSGQDLPALHDDPLINLELQVQALCARLDTARAVCAQAAAMQVVTPALQRIKDNAVWAMRETAPGRVMPRSFAALEAVSPMLAKVPDGYVIVPKEPTFHMLRRAETEDEARAIYKAMLAAAKEDSHER